MTHVVQDIDLGPTPMVWAAFREMAKFDPKGRRFGALFEIALDEEVSDETLAEARKQAKEFLREYGSRIGSHARWILEQLAR